MWKESLKLRSAGLNKLNAPLKSAKTFQKVAVFKATSLLSSDQSWRKRLTVEQGGQAFQKVTNGLFFPSWPKDSPFRSPSQM